MAGYKSTFGGQLRESLEVMFPPLQTLRLDTMKEYYASEALNVAFIFALFSTMNGWF